MLSQPEREPDSVGFSRVIVLAQGGTPTLDYYLPQVERRAGTAPVEVHDACTPCVAPLRLDAPTWVVIFRHAHRSWLDALRQQKGHLARVTWFLDDDIPAITRALALPQLYAWRTHLRYFGIRKLLQTLVTDRAFASQELAERYDAPPSAVWPPSPLGDLAAERPLLYFYHGTASHRAELEWLAPIVARVQEQVPKAWFEVFVDRHSRKLFRSIPRVRCIYPMNWTDFLTHSSGLQADLGLAPLLDTPFNRARAPVKFFDITRTGAAGIYSEGPTYENTVKHGSNGLLLPNNPKDWEEAIIRLLSMPVERRSLAAQAQGYCNSRQT